MYCVTHEFWWHLSYRKRVGSRQQFCTPQHLWRRPSSTPPAARGTLRGRSLQPRLLASGASPTRSPTRPWPSQCIPLSLRLRRWLPCPPAFGARILNQVWKANIFFNLPDLIVFVSSVCNVILLCLQLKVLRSQQLHLQPPHPKRSPLRASQRRRRRRSWRCLSLNRQSSQTNLLHGACSP